MRTNGAAIRALREAHGWRVSTFAVAVGISHSHLSNIEAGRKTKASPAVVRRIADTLGVPLAAVTTDHTVDEVAGSGSFRAATRSA